MKKPFPISILILLFLFLAFAVLASAAFMFVNVQQEKKISNFEECAAAGNPVMESYPAQCITRDGRHFVQELTDEKKRNSTIPSNSYERKP